MTLGDLFALSLSGRRDAPALDGDRTLTFGELDAEVDRLARVLASRGVGSGSRVCLYLRNSPALVAVYLAILRLGAIVVPMNILYRDRELKHIIGDADPVAVIADGDDLEMIPAPWTAWRLAELVAAATDPPDRPPASPIDADAPALIIYTSGTTGAPKGAVLTHNMLCTNALALVTCWQMTAADRLHLTLPLFHVHGLCVGIHSWLISGCLLRLEERFDHQSIARQMLAFRPTVFFGVPTMYVRLLEIEEAAAREIGSRMRLFVSGSAPLPARVWEDFEARFGHRILERYGMSETLINMSNPCVGERRPGSIGLPLPGVSVRIVDDEGQDVGDDQAGEVWVRGPNVLREYLAQPGGDGGSVRRRLVPDGRHRTTSARRLLHAARTAERPHHLRRLQHLPARDRGLPVRAAGRRRGGRGRRRRRAPRRGAGRVHRRGGRMGAGTRRARVPRAARLVQGAPDLHRRRAAAEDGAWQGSEELAGGGAPAAGMAGLKRWRRG